MKEVVAGSDWTAFEVERCVDAYFEHLELDIRGEPFNKSKLYRALAEGTVRTPSSFEFKFQNISAVLDELGREWIAGLAPAPHYQELLAELIGIKLAKFEIEAASTMSKSPVDALEDLAALYIESPPERATTLNLLPEYMETLIKKFDPVTRDMRNREVGEAGEELVLQYEMRYLRMIGRSDLANGVRWVSKIEGDGAGYDILSFDDRGNQKFIEVKTTTGGNKTPFFVSRNEYKFSTTKSDNYHLLRLFNFRRKPRAFEMSGRLENFVRLSTETFRADFRA